LNSGLSGLGAIVKVVIVGEFSQTSRQQIRSVFPRDWQLAYVTPDELDAEIGDAEVIIPEHVRIDGPFLKRAQHLKLVQTGAGFDNVDIEACAAGGVYVANAAGINAAAVAEHVLGFILCWYKNLIVLDGIMKAGAYGVDYDGAELGAQVIGIVGLGNIGRQVARYARAFGMQVLGYDIQPPDADNPAEVETVDFKTLLKRSDIVTLHIFLNSRTRHMIGRDELETMKPGSVLINTSRGPVVDENALIEALQSKKIGGACLDVFETEPLPTDSLLRTLDNVILSPHTAGMPDGLKFHKKRYEYFVENIKRVAAKSAPLNALNRIE
jgi:D-3-phosphoglycerate dehydrogenase